MSADRPQGFTLLEVVVALTIAALALIVLFRAGSDGLFFVDNAARAEEALQRAQSHLAAIGSDVALIQGTAQGDDGGGFHWRLRIEPVARREAQANIGAPPVVTMLYDVEIAVSWPGHGHDRSVVLRTRRLGSSTIAAER